MNNTLDMYIKEQVIFENVFTSTSWFIWMPEKMRELIKIFFRFCTKWWGGVEQREKRSNLQRSFNC